MPGITRMEDLGGEPVPWPGSPIDWTLYSWNWQDTGLRALLSEPRAVAVDSARPLGQVADDILAAVRQRVSPAPSP
jgi:hypothetical protein